MDQIQAFDLVIFLALLAMFVVGYAQGLVRRLLGTGAILFSIVLGALLRPALGGYLEQQWTGLAPAYSHMVAYTAVFLASAVTLSLAIQLTYRPAPLLTRYPVLDEILGGLVGIIEGIIILIAILLILDPYYTLTVAQDKVGPGEFTLLRSIHDLLDDTWTAAVLRDTVIPWLLSVFGFLFPADIVETFGS